jgi:hypothetical protein
MPILRSQFALKYPRQANMFRRPSSPRHLPPRQLKNRFGRPRWAPGMIKRQDFPFQHLCQCRIRHSSTAQRTMTLSYAIQAAVTLSILVLSAIFWACRKYVYMVVTYEAPFERTRDPEREVPGRYLVRLKQGYTLEQHSATTGYDIKRHISGFAGQASHPDRIVYYVNEIEPEMLAAIRADRGVISLSPDHFLNLSPSWRGWPNTFTESPHFEHDDTIYDPSSAPYATEYDPTSPPSLPA